VPAIVSVIVPFYRNMQMLKKHLEIWRDYPVAVRKTMQLIVVDDGSPEPALDAFKETNCSLEVNLYRIKQDIPWNRGGARNLGSFQARTPWLLHMDIDHIMPIEAAQRLAELIGVLETDRWFRFPRYRVGAADETRNKDSLPREQKFGKIKPHIDSYLIPTSMYWDVGGYDEDYSGCLGGGSPFLKQLAAAHPQAVFEEPICLHVYTRDAIPDASDHTLSRDKAEYLKRKHLKEMKNDTRAKNPLRFDWERII